MEWTAEQAADAGRSKRTSEDVEADIRVLMTKHAAIVPRGWQGMKDREILQRRIDTLLDEWAMRREVEAITKPKS